MLLTPHVFLGLYLISNFNPWIALPAALASHFLFDFFYPHWNPHLYTEMKQKGRLSLKTLQFIYWDSGIAIITTLTFMYVAMPNIGQAFLVGLAAFFSIAPDMLEAPYYLWGKKYKWLTKIIFFEHSNQARATKFWGVASQIFVIAICLWGILS